MSQLTPRSLRWTESCARLGDNDADLKFEASYQLIAPETEAPKPETPPPPPSLQELDREYSLPMSFLKDIIALVPYLTVQPLCSILS